jgi:hypothetical protein
MSVIEVKVRCDQVLSIPWATGLLLGTQGLRGRRNAGSVDVGPASEREDVWPEGAC